jgi:hypothetical protein
MGLRGKSPLDPAMVCGMDGAAKAEKSKEVTQRTQRGHRVHGDMENENQARLRAILL